MFFDDCDTPQELNMKIGEFLKIATGRRITFGPGKPTSGNVSLIDRNTDETLRQAYAEARNVAKRFCKLDNNLPPLPDVKVMPLEGLMSISGWCRSITQYTKSVKPAETGQGNKGPLKIVLHPTIKKIVEIIEKLKSLQAKVIGLINKKSIVPDEQVSQMVEGLSISSKVQQKEETKDNVAKLLKTMQQAEIIKMQRKKNWPEDIKRLMNEIIVSLFPYLDYLKEKGTSGKWEQASIEYYIKTGKPSDLDDMIHEIEKIKHKMEVESEQSAPQKLGEIKKPTYSRIKSVSELITQGESHTLEFKETFEYDIRRNQQNKNLNKSSLKTIAAFLNTDGGTLLIGISDSGEVRGIQNDLKYAKGHDLDGFEQKLRHLINDRFAPSPLGNVQIMFEDLQESIVCKVAVEQNLEPIAFDDDFYIRDGNGTRKLKGRAITDWIQQRKKNKIPAESKKESTETELDSKIPIRELLIMNILAAKNEQSEEEILDYLKENGMSNLDCHAAISSLTGKGFIRQTNYSPVSYNIFPRGYQWAMQNKNLFDQLNAEALSDEAKKMLLKAAQGDGVIMKAHNMRERCIQINSENIISSQDPRTVAKWEGGLDELEENDFIKDKSYKGEVFGVTNKGYKYADKIK